MSPVATQIGLTEIVPTQLAQIDDEPIVPAKFGRIYRLLVKRKVVLVNMLQQTAIVMLLLLL